MNNKYTTTIIAIVTISVMIGMISPISEKWNQGWELDKNKMCLPYTASGIVSVYENNSHCTSEEILEREKFIEYYCSDYSCKPVLKTEKQLKKIYEEFASLGADE